MVRRNLELNRVLRRIENEDMLTFEQTGAYLTKIKYDDFFIPSFERNNKRKLTRSLCELIIASKLRLYISLDFHGFTELPFREAKEIATSKLEEINHSGLGEYIVMDGSLDFKRNNTHWSIAANKSAILFENMYYKKNQLSILSQNYNENEELKNKIDLLSRKITSLEAQLIQDKKVQPTTCKEVDQKEPAKKNRDDEIVVYLSFLLAQKSNTFGKSDGSINASQVGQAINEIAQQLGLDKDDMHGFKRPDARIRDLIKENENLLVKFKELVKK